ncbi:uncharacterized protein LY89DRAFT_726786 [Mollisia scopiformis]|uniref:WSC domain-containing protein n=1 Tax=Mollisia scopiformis TaxID=149040 RepID=A0A194XVI4_MOLSC|nr:uncharacterized protein LY89DRAFT_726786 [Mollisia scopiformis]KUJ23722.1 hypothetical protein LY89DRAFT_726786 [Mollisia scopiformis]
MPNSWGFTEAALNGPCNVLGGQAVYLGCFLTDNGDFIGAYPPAGTSYWTTIETPYNSENRVENCYGDFTQTGCGWQVKYYADGYDYQNSSLDGIYAAAVYVDPSFATDGSLVPSIEQYNFKYLGCLEDGEDGADENTGILRPVITVQLTASSTFMLDCFEFCASLNMPYAGLASQTTNTGYFGPSTSTTCLCGVSFRGIVFPIANSDESCNGSPVTGLAWIMHHWGQLYWYLGTRWCNVTGGIWFAFYRNPNYLGCYEPPILGITPPPVENIYSSAYCFPSNYPPGTTSKTLPSFTSGAITVNTQIPAAQVWVSPQYPQYTYLGCYGNGSIFLDFTNMTQTPTDTTMLRVEDCMQYCSGAGGNGTIHAAVYGTAYLGGKGIVCLCGNNVNLNNQLYAWNCTYPCGVGGSNLFGELCDGYDAADGIGSSGTAAPGGFNVAPIGLYGPTSLLTASPAGVSRSITQRMFGRAFQHPACLEPTHLSVHLL